MMLDNTETMQQITNPSLKFNFLLQYHHKNRRKKSSARVSPPSLPSESVSSKGGNNSGDQVQRWIGDGPEFALQQWLCLHCMNYFLPPTTTSTSGPGRVSAAASPVLLLLVLFLRHGLLNFTLQGRQDGSYFKRCIRCTIHYRVETVSDDEGVGHVCVPC